MTTILIVRHGETDWNRERRLQGHSDISLNETGRDQARALAQALAETEIDAIYSSNLRRAYETAQIIAETKRLPITTVGDLRERHFGTWEGMTGDEIFDRFPHARNGPWGDAETKEEMTARILDGLERIAAAHPEGRVLVVTHGGPVRALLDGCGVERDGPIGNCSLHEVRFLNGRFAAVGVAID